MQLNDAGQMVQSIWDSLPMRFAQVTLDAFVIMPNHIHGIFVISDLEGEDNIRYQDYLLHRLQGQPSGTLPGTLGRIIQAFKSVTTHEYTVGVKQRGWQPFPGRLWQRNYHEHIIRNEYSLNRIREYIATNPQCWLLDRENPQREGISEFYSWLEVSKVDPPNS